MAEIVLGVGVSHTPQLSSGPQWWEGHAGRDRQNPYLLGTDGEPHTFDELARGAPAGLEAQLVPQVWEKKFAQAQDAVAEVGRRLAQAAADVLVVVGDDQRELFGDDGNPAIGLFLGDELWDQGSSEARWAATPMDIRPAQWAAHADEPEVYPVARGLSEHVATELTEAGFDIGVFSRQAEGRSLGHAFTFPRRRLGVASSTPMVPIALNTYYPPNVPSAARCWALGVALGAALKSWGGPDRVALVASGGLSHFVVNEALDRQVLEALAKGDGQTLAAIPRKHLRSGNSEILNWVVVGGVMARWPMEVIDYIPGYRSVAGTGTGMAFATWGPGKQAA